MSDILFDINALKHELTQNCFIFVFEIKPCKILVWFLIKKVGNKMDTKQMILPSLQTNRLAIRQVQLSDAPFIFTLRSDDTINVFLDRKKAENLDDAALFIKKISKNIAEGNTSYWVIDLMEEQFSAGTICIFNMDENEKSCEIGFELLPMFQKKGMMKEAALAVISYLIQENKFKKIKAFVHQENINSIGLLKTLGFVLTNEKETGEPDMAYFNLDLPK